MVGGDPWRDPARSSASGSPSSTRRRSSARSRDLDPAAHLGHRRRVRGPGAARRRQPLGAVLVGAAVFTCGEALVGFSSAACSASALGDLFVHSGCRAGVGALRRASQTIPIVALAPIIVFALRRTGCRWSRSSTYLTFFPVTIAAIRGLRVADPRALELLRSYAAAPAASSGSSGCRRPCRTCSRRSRSPRRPRSWVPSSASARRASPRARPARSSTATSTTRRPEKLWATIVVCAIVGIAFFVVWSSWSRRSCSAVGQRPRRAAE